MSLNDPISDFLTRIRNGAMARFRFVDLPFSKLHVAIATVLQEKGFVENFLVDEPGRRMRLFLRYDKRRLPVLHSLSRASTPGLRRYLSYQKIPRVFGGLGVAVVSTSQGVMDGEKARSQKLGGELLCVAW